MTARAVLDVEPSCRHLVPCRRGCCIDQGRPRVEPFPGSPSQTLAAGWCPGCGGTGQVDACVPTPGLRACSLCEGGGTVAALEARGERIARAWGWL